MSTTGTGLPKRPLQRLVLRCSYPANSRNFHQLVDPPCGWSANTDFGTRSLLENSSVASAICSTSNLYVPLPLSLAILWDMSDTLILLRISSFLILSPKNYEYDHLRCPLRDILMRHPLRSRCHKSSLNHESLSHELHKDIEHEILN